MADAMSFRCPKHLRDDFSAKAQENGTNASSLLKEFMRQYIENPHILGKTKNTEVNTNSQYTTQDSIDNSIDVKPKIETSDTKKHVGQSILALQRRIDELEQDTTVEALDTEKLLNLLEGWSVPLLGINGEVMERLKELEKIVMNQTDLNEKANPKSQPSTSSDGNKLSGAALCKRLGCDKKTLWRWRNQGKLQQKTKERDPDGKPWKYDPDDKIYVEV